MENPAHFSLEINSQPCDDSAAREHFRIGRQHHRRHGAARGHPRDEHARRVNCVIINDFLDHVTDGEWLTASAVDVASLEPVEVAKEVVGCSLPRKQKRHPALIGKSGPTRSDVIALCRLGAAMQHHDEGAVFTEVLGNIGIRAQRSGVRSETFQDFQAIASI